MNNFKIFTAIVLASSLFISCSKNNNCVSGSGGYVTKSYNTSAFTALSISGQADVIITKDSVQFVRIEAQQNILDELDVEVKSGTLSIGEDDCIQNYKRLKIYISAPSITGLATAGSVNLLSPSTFSGNVFNASLSGSGKMEINISVNEFNGSIEGSGDIKASGVAVQQYFTTSGDGFFECFNLVGEDVDINVSGEATLEVHATKTLHIDVSGSASIYYKGNPSITQNISGSATIVDAN